MDTLNTHEAELEVLPCRHKEEGQSRRLQSHSVSPSCHHWSKMFLLFVFDITPPVSYFKWGDDGLPPGVTAGKVILFFLPGRVVVGIHDNPQKRDQDLCFWCHRVIRVKYPPVDGPYGLGRVSWVNMCDSQPHASPSADFSLSRNK